MAAAYVLSGTHFTAGACACFNAPTAPKGGGATTARQQRDNGAGG